MFLPFWIQYPLDTRLNWEFVSNRTRIVGRFFLNNVHNVCTTIFLAWKNSTSLVSSSFRQLTSSYREQCVSQSLPFRVALFISLCISYFLLVFFLLIVFVLTVALFAGLSALLIGVLVVWFLGLLATFIVWLFLYRIPLYDVIYLCIKTWILQHNSAVYHRLPRGADISTSHIRVVRIKPGSSQDMVECQFLTESIAAAEFDALSYLWGTTIVPRRIKVDGTGFYVTYNLFSALRELRRPDRDRLVWIDALCINQSDDAEKSNQVRLMRTVYAKASNVIVWLGPGSKNTASTFNLFRQFSDTRTKEDRDHLWANMTSSRDWRHISLEFERILSHEWWTRAWIIQEVVVARHVLVRRGSEQLDWDIIQPLFEHIPFRKMFSFRSSTEFADRVQQLRNQLFADNALPTTLFDLVYEFRHQFATLGSDKIFALLGLVQPGCYTMVSPDYSRSAEEVFLDFTVASLTEEKISPSWV
ncbi:heterokaryon incompatibility protein-domain-containing protein [Xylaria sp. FL0064]|nr:heterokaryon incompatibility protein-domain-containing protein [Xylaria sp. FL0064]